MVRSLGFVVYEIILYPVLQWSFCFCALQPGRTVSSQQKAYFAASLGSAVRCGPLVAFAPLCDSCCLQSWFKA
jgi:hypothetical protein